MSEQETSPSQEGRDPERSEPAIPRTLADGLNVFSIEEKLARQAETAPAEESPNKEDPNKEDGPGAEEDDQGFEVLPDASDTAHEGLSAPATAARPQTDPRRPEHPATDSARRRMASSHQHVDTAMLERLPDATDDDAEAEPEEATRRRKPLNDLDNTETREVPVLKDEWRKKAALVASAMGENADLPSDDAGWIEMPAEKPDAQATPPQARQAEPARREPSPVYLEARRAQQRWKRRRFEQRLPHLESMRQSLVDLREDYVPALATAIGKPMVEAICGEYLPVLDALKLLPRVVPPLLVDHVAIDLPPLLKGATVKVSPEPWGVVLIVASASSPFGYPVARALDALATGNAVILHLSDARPKANQIVRKIFDHAGLPSGLLQVFAGVPDSVRPLLDGRPDKVVCSADMGFSRRMAGWCAQRSIPFDIPPEGKSLLAILHTADMETAVQAAVAGAFAGGGLAAGAAERIVVDDRIYDEFRMRFIEAVRIMNCHHAQLANTRHELDLQRIDALLSDAVARGARVTYPTGGSPGKWIHWRTAVVEGLSDDARLTFERAQGPVATLYRAQSVDDEVARLLEYVPAPALNILGECRKDRREALEAMAGDAATFNDMVGVGGGGGPAYGGPIHTLCGPAAMLRQRYSVDSPAGTRRVWWFPYTDDKAVALMDALPAWYGNSMRERLRASLRLASMPGQKRLLESGQ